MKSKAVDQRICIKELLRTVPHIVEATITNQQEIVLISFKHNY